MNRFLLRRHLRQHTFDDDSIKHRFRVVKIVRMTQRLETFSAHVLDQRANPKQDKSGTLTLTDSRTHITYSVRFCP